MEDESLVEDEARRYDNVFQAQVSSSLPPRYLSTCPRNCYRYQGYGIQLYILCS